MNFTRDKYEYTHQVAATADAPGENGSVDFMYCRIWPGNAYFYECEKGSLVAGKNSVNPGKPVPLDPRAGHNSPQYRVGVHYQSESPLVNGVDQFGFSEVTTNVQVIVTVDPEFAAPVQPHPDADPADEPVMPVFDVQTQEYRCSWTFDRVFVPNESLILRWQAPAPRPAATAAAAPQQEVVSVRTR